MPARLSQAPLKKVPGGKTEKEQRKLGLQLGNQDSKQIKMFLIQNSRREFRERAQCVHRAEEEAIEGREDRREEWRPGTSGLRPT